MEVPAKGLNKESSFCVNRKKKSINCMAAVERIGTTSAVLQLLFKLFPQLCIRSTQIAKMFVAM